MSELGFVTWTDNHGNSTRGRTLTCAGKPPVTLSAVDTADMHFQVLPQTAVAFNVNGEVHLGSMESPLQTACRKLEAARQSSVPR